jgi:hypothetical protein
MGIAVMVMALVLNPSCCCWLGLFFMGGLEMSIDLTRQTKGPTGDQIVVENTVRSV